MYRSAVPGNRDQPGSLGKGAGRVGHKATHTLTGSAATGTRTRPSFDILSGVQIH